MNQRALAAAISDAVIPILAEALASAIEPLVKRIKVLEERPQFDLDGIKAVLTEEVAKAFASIEKPEPITVKDMIPEIRRAVAEEFCANPPLPGEPGRDADMEAISAEIERKFLELPKARDGNSVSLEEVLPEIRKAVAEEYAANPPAAGKDGKDIDVEAVGFRAYEIAQKLIGPVVAEAIDKAEFKDPKLDPEVVRVEVARQIADLPRPEDGKDGEGVKELLIDAEGILVVTTTKGEIKRVGRVVGRDGKDGEKGTDGLGFEDMDEFLDEDGRTVVRRYASGDVVKEFRHTFRVPLDAGIWKEGQRYIKGDGVTYGGSWWIAQKDNPQGRPDSGNQDFRLAVKKGRDGKDGKAPPGPIGPVSVPGAKS